jgi:hypothetical protein
MKRLAVGAAVTERWSGRGAGPRDDDSSGVVSFVRRLVPRMRIASPWCISRSIMEFQPTTRLSCVSSRARRNPAEIVGRPRNTRLQAGGGRDSEATVATAFLTPWQMTSFRSPQMADKLAEPFGHFFLRFAALNDLARRQPDLKSWPCRQFPPQPTQEKRGSQTSGAVLPSSR